MLHLANILSEFQINYIVLYAEMGSGSWLTGTFNRAFYL
jgi:hypothetical protein